MKHFKLMIKAILKKPFKALSAILFCLLWFGSINFYKIYFVGTNNFIQMNGDITLSRAFLIPAFVLIVLLSLIIPVGSLRESLKMNVHMLVPDIRKDELQFYAVNLLLLFIWITFMIGVGDLIFLIIFLMFCFWFISLMIAALFGLRFIYRSDKYRWLKILYYPLYLTLSSIYMIFEIPGSFLLPAYILTIVYFSITVYHIVNFYNNIVNYKEDYERNYRSGFTRFLGGDFVGHFEYKTKYRSIYRLIKKYKETGSQHIQAKLYQYILFRSNSNRVVIIGTVFTWASYYAVILIMGIKYGMLLVFYMYIYSAFTSINTFRSRELIQHLYITSGLNRKEFESTILISYLSDFFKYTTLDGVIIFILFFVHKHYYIDLSITPIILLYIISFTARVAIVYGCWSESLKNKDYDTINKKRFLAI